MKITTLITGLTLGVTTAGAMAQNAGYREYDPNTNTYREQTTTVYTQQQTQPTTVYQQQLQQPNTSFYVNDRGERVYYTTNSTTTTTTTAPYNDSAFNTYTQRNVYVQPQVGYVQQPATNVYGNVGDRVIVDRYTVSGPTERVVAYEPRFWRGHDIQFRGQLVGLNRVWSEAMGGYADIATVKQGDGSLVDFHVKNWKDLELNHFKLGDIVTIKADAKDIHGRNVLVLDEINRK